jgi:hypothetical protein
MQQAFRLRVKGPQYQYVVVWSVRYVRWVIEVADHFQQCAGLIETNENVRTRDRRCCFSIRSRGSSVANRLESNRVASFLAPPLGRCSARPPTEDENLQRGIIFGPLGCSRGFVHRRRTRFAGHCDRRGATAAIAIEKSKAIATRAGMQAAVYDCPAQSGFSEPRRPRVGSPPS